MKKRQLTPEQEAARAAKGERFRELMKKIAAMPEAERAKLADQCGTVVTCEGRALSVKNTILCFLQHPPVSVVGGFRQWIKAGRCVRKGEHGFTIWIPLGHAAGDSAEESSEGDGGEGGQKFGTATVFDIGQTAELAAEEPVAVVSPEVAAAFGMQELPNVRSAEAVA